MQIMEQKIGEVLVAKLVGKLDAATAPSASNHLRRLTSADALRLILDLSEPKTSCMSTSPCSTGVRSTPRHCS
jgi:anti-anti-sigma regulatory factor